MLSYLNVHASTGIFLFSFSIRSIVPLLFIPPSPLIPIYHQPFRIENDYITCFLNHSGGFDIVFSS